MSNSGKSIETIAESVNLTVDDINEIKKTQKPFKISWKLLITFETFITSLSALQGYKSKKTFVEYISYTADFYPYAALSFGSTILSIKNSKNGKSLFKLTLFIIITAFFSLLGNYIGFQLSGGHTITTIFKPEIISSSRYGVYSKNK